MKKIILTLSALLCAASMFAGGVDNKSNLNTGYLRNPSRNVEIKRPEAVLYNIAGTGFMEDGLYFNAGNQFVFKEYTNELNGTEYKDKEKVFFFPNFEAVYKQDKWAAFFGFGIFAGGGSLDFSDGNAAVAATFATNAKKYAAKGNTTRAAMFSGAAVNHSLKVYSVTMGEILGGSYVFNDMISVAAAGRFLHGNQNMSLKASSISALNGGDELSYEASGCGFGGIFGVNITPVENLYLSIQYQTITKLDFEYNTMKGALTPALLSAKEGDKFHNDLPAVLGLGAGYNVLDNLFVNTSFNYYFNKQASLENPMGGTSLDYDDSWEIGLGAEYQLNDKIGFSAGAMYSKQGYKSDVNSAFNPVLNSIVGGLGVEYQVIKQLTLTAAYMHCRYFNDDYNSAIDLKKNVYLGAIGVTYKPF